MLSKHRIVGLFLYLVALISYLPYLAQDSDTILMVVSSYGQDQGETQPGYEFDEFAKAYIIFKQNGYKVQVASPKGGAVEADKYDPDRPFNKEVLSDEVIMSKLADTIPTAEFKAAEYAAIFIVGGKGAMFDLPKDTHLQTLVSTLYENDAVVSAVCHGPAALVNVKLSNGDYLVSGKRVNGFTNIEEQAFGKKWLPQFEFLLQDKLIERGGQFESSAMMLNHVAVDGRLITGQNPFSTTNAALEVVKALGKTPKKHVVYKEDATLNLMARVMNGDNKALGELTSNTESYQIDLAGMYGYYLFKYAEDNTQIEHAISIMDAANVHMNHPVLNMSIIKGHGKLGQNDVALEKARKLAAELPENEKVQALLASLEAS